MTTHFTTPKDSSQGFLDPIMIWWSLFSESKIKAKLTDWTNKRVAQKIANRAEAVTNRNTRRKKKELSYSDWKNIDETLLMIVIAIKIKMGEFASRYGPDQQRFWRKPKKGGKDRGAIIRESISRPFF